MALTFIADGACIVSPRPSKRALFVALVLVSSQFLLLRGGRLLWQISPYLKPALRLAVLVLWFGWMMLATASTRARLAADSGRRSLAKVRDRHASRKGRNQKNH